METTQKYTVFLMEGIRIVHNGTRYEPLEVLRADLPEAAIIPVEEVPENWPDMTVENGQLVPAPADVLEARREAENARKAEAVRSARETRYRTETDPMLFDAMEAYSQAHPEEPAFADWLAAKNLIREELPKPEGGTAND